MILRLLTCGFLIISSIMMLHLFVGIAIGGSVLIYEDNIYILATEIVMFTCFISIGIYSLLREFKHLVRIRQDQSKLPFSPVV